MLELVKIKRDNITKEETIVPLFLLKSDIVCLYKGRGGNFITTKQGFMHKVPYPLEEIELIMASDISDL
jgi:hypothetical protein